MEPIFLRKAGPAFLRHPSGRPVGRLVILDARRRSQQVCVSQWGKKQVKGASREEILIGIWAELACA